MAETSTCISNSQETAVNLHQLSPKALTKYQNRVQNQLTVKLTYKDPLLKITVHRKDGLFECFYGCIAHRDPASLRVHLFKSICRICLHTTTAQKHALRCKQVRSSTDTPRLVDFSPCREQDLLELELEEDESVAKAAILREITVPHELIGAYFTIDTDDDFQDEVEECPPTTLTPIDFSAVTFPPEQHTVLHHPSISLRSLGIAVNTLFRCVICLQCSRAVECLGLPRHLHQHLKYVDIPVTLCEDLAQEFEIVPLANIKYYKTPVPPVFGVPVEPVPFHFCEVCHRGYQHSSGLRSHQYQTANRESGQRHSGMRMGYAQIITDGPNRRYFEVDISSLRPRVNEDYSTLFEQQHPLPVDFSKLPIRSVQDAQNLSQFFYRERWTSFVEGYQPHEIIEACRSALPNETLGEAIKQAAVRHLSDAQKKISSQQSFGLLKKIAQICPK